MCAVKFSFDYAVKINVLFYLALVQWYVGLHGKLPLCTCIIELGISAGCRISKSCGLLLKFSNR